MKFAFVLPHRAFPEHMKLIRALERRGVDGRVLAFERGVDPGGGDHPRTEVLGRLEDGAYLRRTAAFAAVSGSLRKAAREVDVLYCFGVDLLLLGLVAAVGLRRRPLLVCHVSDIPPVLLGDSVRSALLARTDRVAVGSTDLLVVSSEAYLDGYYRSFPELADLPAHLLENKVAEGSLRPAPGRRPLGDRPLRLVWSGMMRCESSLSVLGGLAQAAPERFRIELHGHLSGPLAGREDSLPPGLDYRGPFRNPEELPRLFETADLAWIAHDQGRSNSLWARACRFYQAGWFGVPLVAQEGTQDALVVADEGLGPVIDLRQPERAVQRLAGIRDEEIDAWQSRVVAMPDSTFAQGEDVDSLFERLCCGAGER